MSSRCWSVPFLIVLGLAACGGSNNESPMAVTEPAVAQGEPAATPDDQNADPAGVSGLRLKRIGTFSNPVYLTAPPGDRSRLFVVEQEGTIRVVRNGRQLDRPYIDLTDRVLSGGEQGLLSMAFAPDYAKSHRFYVYFTDQGGDIRVQEFRGSGNRARRSTGRSIIKVEHSQNGNHNGGQLQFGPDGFLYIGTGDGGGGGDPFEAGQDLGQLLGKLLRINPRGRPFRVPSSNPFVNRRGARNSVYSYGLRNPWRFSFDRKTGDLTIADVGQSEVEEVDFVRRGKGSGANFGWDAFEGSQRYEGGSAPGHIPPVIEHTHGEGFCSITGGYVLRHSSYGSLRGIYVYADLCEGVIRGARLSPGNATGRRRLGNISSPSSFGEDARGRVYAVSLDGPVFRLVPR